MEYSSEFAQPSVKHGGGCVMVHFKIDGVMNAGTCQIFLHHAIITVIWLTTVVFSMTVIPITLPMQEEKHA